MRAASWLRSSCDPKRTDGRGPSCRRDRAAPCVLKQHLWRQTPAPDHPAPKPTDGRAFKQACAGAGQAAPHRVLFAGARCLRPGLCVRTPLLRRLDLPLQPLHVVGHLCEGRSATGAASSPAPWQAVQHGTSPSVTCDEAGGAATPPRPPSPRPHTHLGAGLCRKAPEKVADADLLLVHQAIVHQGLQEGGGGRGPLDRGGHGAGGHGGVWCPRGGSALHQPPPPPPQMPAPPAARP